MLNFEQVKLLEEKVAKAIDYVERVSKEKNILLSHEAELKGSLDAYQKRETDLLAKLESCKSRIDELEALVRRFKEDQSKIEEGILAALDRLSQFEKDIEKSLKDKPHVASGGKTPRPSPKKQTEEAGQDAAEGLPAAPGHEEEHPAPDYGADADKEEEQKSVPISDAQGETQNEDDPQEKGRELDIF